MNHRHLHFQCSALPTELPGRRTRRTAGGRARGVIKARFPAVQTSWRTGAAGTRSFRKMPHAPAAFASCPGIVGAILDEVRREADKVFGPCRAAVAPRWRSNACCEEGSPRPRHGRVINHEERSRIRDEYIVDYVTGLCYDAKIPLMRGVSGDDPEGGAGCGVDRGW